ncbi:MAG: diaminopimelate decarboxylase [Bacteroidales bacterium]
MFTKEEISRFRQIPTPFYYYKLELLKKTLEAVAKESALCNFKVHYALKANSNDEILKIISSYGFGADCVSGNEISKALACGFLPKDVVFAGVGKTDKEINLGIEEDIFCFNCESIAELQIINELAINKNKTAKVALRINPNINANTHHYITTGLEENKFGINVWELETVIELLTTLKNIKLTGLHFHIGSQITDLSVFKGLCIRVNEIQEWFSQHHILPDHINVGGGLGVNYEYPNENLLPDFRTYFKIFKEFLELKPNQILHFELGRSIVAQCGALISSVIYIKEGVNTNFAIIDAGMTELIRPALYHAYHKVENLTSNSNTIKRYDVVGPICESSDCFAKSLNLAETKRGDIIAIRTTGAYGETMASQYNLRDLAKAVYSS